MKWTGRFAASVWIASASIHAAAQKQDGYRLRMDSQLIETTLTVRDSTGGIVSNLPQGSFRVREDGVEQAVRYFASKRDLPLSVGLIVDASGSQDRFVHEHEKQMEVFLRAVLEPRDRMFAVCFGNHLRLVNDWTNSAETVMENLHRFNQGRHGFPELGPKEDRELGTALYDAVFYAVHERMQGERGRRKVLILFSDGEENSSEYDLVDAITEAQSANVLVYALRTTEHSAKDTNARDRYGMRALGHLTEQTGGQTFNPQTMQAEEIFSSIADDLKSLYEIGYYSTNPERDGLFRKVTITVDGDGMKVRARSGYVTR